MRTDHTRIGVLESRWWKDSNISIRSFFDVLADMSCHSPHAYHYEMVGSEEAAKEAIPRLAKDIRLKLLCIAMHGDADGDKKGLHLHNGSVLTRAELRNCLLKDDRVVLDGLHLASCSVGSWKFAKFLFDSETCVKWISGYRKPVDWVDAAALELLFFQHWIMQRDESPPIETIQHVASKLMERAFGLVDELGFGIYVRQKRTGLIVNLLQGESVE